MANLKTYEIPIDIQELEFYENTSKIRYFDTLVKQSRSDQQSYTSAFTALIHMEEAANSTTARSFNLYSIKMKIKNAVGNLFKIDRNVRIIFYVEFIFAQL